MTFLKLLIIGYHVLHTIAYFSYLIEEGGKREREREEIGERDAYGFYCNNIYTPWHLIAHLYCLSQHYCCAGYGALHVMEYEG